MNFFHKGKDPGLELDWHPPLDK